MHTSSKTEKVPTKLEYCFKGDLTAEAQSGACLRVRAMRDQFEFPPFPVEKQTAFVSVEKKPTLGL